MLHQNVKCMMTAKMMKSVKLAAVRMHAESRPVEAMRNAHQGGTLPCVHVFLGTQAILSMHASQVSIVHNHLNAWNNYSMMSFSVSPVTEPALAAGCRSDSDCPDYAACANRLCINPCAAGNPCAPSANCKVVNHQPVCTCPDGYIGTPTTDCRPRMSAHALSSIFYV